MSRFLISGGALAALVGLALILPAHVEWREKGSLPAAGVVVILLGVPLVLGGAGAILRGVRTPRDRATPWSVAAALSLNILFAALFALEVSDGLVRRGGALHPMSSVALPPALVLLYGQLGRRRWAWLAARATALAGTLWFLGGAAVMCAIRPHDQHGPVWVWIAGVSLALGSLAAAGFCALGRPSARGYFGIECPSCEGRFKGVKHYFVTLRNCHRCGHVS